MLKWTKWTSLADMTDKSILNVKYSMARCKLQVYKKVKEVSPLIHESMFDVSIINTSLLTT